MFGYVVANQEALSEAQFARYKGAYCGLCRALKRQHGSISRMALTYDMVFLLLLLGSLYEPEEQSGSERCVAHPVKVHDYWSTELTQYVADMSIALAYCKQLDDWQDEKKLISLTASKLFAPHYRDVKAHYPMHCRELETQLAALATIEKSGVLAPDEAANCFGKLMGGLFIWKQDRWTDILYEMGCALGRFVYIMDACMDLESDRRHGRYNPMAGRDPAEFEPILTMLIGDCALEFEKLPLVQDLDILRNILYSGVWTRYRMAQKNNEKKGNMEL